MRGNYINRSALWKYKKGKQNDKKKGTGALAWHKNLWTIANDTALLQSAYRSAAVSGQVCRPFDFTKQSRFINGFHNSRVDAHLFQRHWSRNQLHRHLSAPLVPDRFMEGAGEGILPFGWNTVSTENVTELFLCPQLRGNP